MSWARRTSSARSSFSLLLTLARSARKAAPPLAFVPKPPQRVAPRQTAVTSAPKTAPVHPSRRLAFTIQAGPWQPTKATPNSPTPFTTP